MGSDHVNFLGRLFSNIRGFSPPPSFLPLRELVMETQLPRPAKPSALTPPPEQRRCRAGVPQPPPAQSEGCWPAKAPGPLPTGFQVPEPATPEFFEKGRGCRLPLPPSSSYTRDSHTGTESESWLCMELSPVSESSSLPGQLLASPRAWSTHTSAQACGPGSREGPLDPGVPSGATVSSNVCKVWRRPWSSRSLLSHCCWL